MKNKLKKFWDKYKASIIFSILYLIVAIDNFAFFLIIFAVMTTDDLIKIKEELKRIKKKND